MFDYLSERIKKAILRYDLSSLTEVRLRVNKPVVIAINGNYKSLNDIIFTSNDMEYMILRLTKRSVYAYQDNILSGYLVGDDGERVGIAGKCIYNGGELKNIVDFTSACIRIPHEVIGCADITIEKCFFDGLKSLLVISPPAGGKTTFLRDCARVVSANFGCNVLIVDEKGELFGNGRFNVGDTTDVVRNCRKSYGFNQGVLNMRPDVIICDELFDYYDINSAKNAVLSGVSVLASAHGENVEELSKRSFFTKILNEQIFDYAVVLSSKLPIGSVKEIIRL